MSPNNVLAARLKYIRLHAAGDHPLTQSKVASAVGVGVPSISAWENGKSTPPKPRLERYARLAALKTWRSELPPVDELSAEESAAYEQAWRELSALWSRVSTRQGPRSPWEFPPGEDITIVCSELPLRYREQHPYSDPEAPDHIKALKFADLDALIELAGYVQALNPRSKVERKVAGEMTDADRRNHLIALGGIDFNPIVRHVLVPSNNATPFSQEPRPKDEDEGFFRVAKLDSDELFRPHLIPSSSGRRTLVEDVSLFLRLPNIYESRPSRTLTICNGMYAKGTHAAVRALTDPYVGENNVRYLQNVFDTDSYGILFYVTVAANEVITPDWSIPDERRYEWMARSTTENAE